MQQSYAPAQRSPMQDLKSEVPHILVLVGLLLILLVILTRYKWIHCSEVVKFGPVNIPTNWCQFYCENLHGPGSNIAIVYGDDGIGDPNLLYNKIQAVRPYAVPVMIKISDFAYSGLKNFDLVIVKKARRLTPTQANAIASYMTTGGTLVWVGDSGTEFYISDEERQEALRLNGTRPGYYENYVKVLNWTNSVGFGPVLSSYLGVKFQDVQNGSGRMSVQRIDKYNLLTSGLADEITFERPGKFARVTFDQSRAFMAAKLVSSDGNESYPAIVETRNVRKLVSVYFAFPPEKSPSNALFANLFDYVVLC